jgi:hypothetical protein
MAYKTDLYSILISYAGKNNSPYIGIDSFLDFLGKYAKKASGEHPEWLKWVSDRQVKFWSEISALVEEGKCELLTDTADGRVYMPQFYRELIEKSYMNADQNADLPFPGEESLKITLPENQIYSLTSDYDLLNYLNEPPRTEVPVLRLNFPDGFGSALVLAKMVPRRLAETAILKISNYLRRSGNKEYAARKLAPHLQGRESVLLNQINQVLTKPLDCYTSVEMGSELPYLFWANLCILVKNDIKMKNERLNEDVAAFQSAFIIEVINGYFKSLAVKRREVDLALKSLENHLAKPPFIYTPDQILKFTNAKGVLLLSQYTNGDLQEWLRKKTTETENNRLPALLIVQGETKGGRCFLLKEKMLPLCVRFLSEARVRVKDEIARRWRRLLSEYKNEKAMENDGEFEKLLARVTKKISPALVSLLEDPKLLLVYDEAEQNQGTIPPGANIFGRGHLLPYPALLAIRRKEMLSDAKLFLPFWYSMPILTAVIAFFKNLSKKRKAVELAPAGAGDTGKKEPGREAKDRTAKIRAAAEELEYAVVPAGYTMDSYLEELESRWTRIINRQGRENLIEDIKSLIRDHLKMNLRISKQFNLSRDIISQMADNIVTRNPSLASLGGRDSLVLYSELYLIKLLQNIR